MEQKVIGLERLYDDEDWKEYCGRPIVPIGAETETHNLIGNLENGFNLLVGGKTGSGKSNFFHCAITSLLKNTNAYDFRFILMDPKRVELSMYYKDLPSLLHPVIWNVKEAIVAMQWCMFEIDRRNELFEKEDVFTIDEYRAKTNKEMPRVLILIDEYAGLIENDYWFFEKAIRHIIESGQTAGMNIIMGTSKVSASSGYTRKLSELFRFRIAFKTFNAEDSKAVLGFEGGEKLQGNGDLLMINTETETPVRAQGFYISEEEIKKAVEDYMKENKVFEPESLLFKFLLKFFPGVVAKGFNYIRK